MNPKRTKREPWPKIRKAEHKNGTIAWMVDARIKGVGERLFYPTKGEAETKADQLRATRANEGTSGVAIPDKLRVEALECSKLLRPLDVSLTEAVRYYIAHARPEGGARTVSELVQEFLKAKEEGNRRPTYIAVQRTVLGKFARTFGATQTHEVHPEEVWSWLLAQEWSDRTRLNYFNDVRNLFGFAVRKGYCASNPFVRMEAPAVDEAAPPGILTPVQAKALLGAAQARENRLTAFYAIGLFAGLRTVELLSLEWRHVDLERGTIEVTAQNAKTRQHRYVTISKNLQAWLSPLAKASGLIRPPAWRYDSQQTRQAAGITEWPDNAMRHSFGSYHFAQHGDATKTANELGHRGNTTTLFAHYRALVKPSEASKFWGILP